LTVTANEHVAVAPTASLAVQVTVVVPIGNAEPDGGTQFTATQAEFGLEAEVVKVTTAELCDCPAVTAMFDGHAIVGGGADGSLAE
jgi:hypothetical protein